MVLRRAFCHAMAAGLIGALTAWMAPPAALADGCGQALGKPTVNIRSEFGEPVLDLSRGIRALIADPNFASTRSAAFPYTLGVTFMMMDGGLNTNFIGEPRLDGTFCWSVQSLDITLRAITTVYIGSEIPRDTCLWHEVREHEEKHVEANRQFFPRLAEMLRPRVLEAARRTLAARTDAEAKAFFESAINGAVQEARQKFEAAIHERHRTIDTPQEYTRVSGACGDAEMRSVLTRAGIS